MPGLYLLDGHSLAYRAFYALPTDLATQSGQVTNAVYGFTSMLIKVLGEERPEGIAVCFDMEIPRFRLETYSEYKAGRRTMPDIFRPQIELIREVLHALRIPIIEVPGLEADDVMATLGNEAAADGQKVTLVTGDRDIFQCIRDPLVRVMYTMRGVSETAFFDEKGIVERYGVRPDQYGEYAALRGDNSDNLPGAPGVGEKTAATLLQKYENLEGIYEHLDQVPARARKGLDEAREQVFRNREVIRLISHAELPIEWTDCRQQPYDAEEVRNLFNSLAFRTLIPRLEEALPGGGLAAPATALDTAVSVVRGSLAKWLTEDDDPVAVEAVYDARGEIQAVGVAAASGEKVGFSTDAGGLDGHRVVAHHGKELMAALPAVELADDTLLLSYLLDPDETRYRLEDLALKYLGVELASPDDAGTRGKQLALEGPDADEVGRRAAVVGALAPVLAEGVKARRLDDLYRDIELPLARILATMERTGIRVDRDYLEELSAEFHAEVTRLTQAIYDMCGEEFNINSNPQLQVILYDKLGVPRGKKIKTGFSTDAQHLESLRYDYPVCDLLLQYREVEKLRSTYTDALLPLIGPDGRIHTRFNQASAATGRLASESPNLMNIPVRSEIGRRIRRAFVAEDGWELLIADYNQIELRVLAHLSQDPGLVDAFATERDIHRAIAGRIFGVEPADVNFEMRNRAKVFSFGIAYGMEAFGLSQRLQISPEEARQFIDAYFEGFPSVKEYMDGSIARARSDGFTTTIFGRRRQIPELQHRSYAVRMMGERMARNAGIQGSAADIIKIAMVKLDETLREAGLRSRPLLQVHDELVIEVPTDEKEKAEKQVREAMEGAADLSVPLVVSASFGKNWAEAKGG